MNRVTKLSQRYGIVVNSTVMWRSVVPEHTIRYILNYLLFPQSKKRKARATCSVSSMANSVVDDE